MIRGGRSYVTSLPAFSNDGRKLLVCSGNAVSIFSTATGLQITSLEGHTALVSVVIVVPAWSSATKMLCYCWTASLDGTIRYWDFSAPELLRTVEVRLPIFSMVIPSIMREPHVESNGETGDLFAYVSVKDSSLLKEGTEVLRGHIRRCNLTKGRVLRGETLKETGEPKSIILSPSADFFGIYNKCKLHIWKSPSKQTKRAFAKKLTLHHTKIMTTLAFHPTQTIVAGGDVTGRILIWRGVGSRKFSSGESFGNGGLNHDAEDRPGVRADDDAESCTTWHWHPSAVSVLAFSSDGAYLYSGGKEGVLVVWQLDTGKKKFLPRIGSPLLYFTFSADPTLSAVSCADNQVHLLKMPSMQVLKTISGVKPPPSLPGLYEGLTSGIAFDGTNGSAVLCTENYCVQFYSLFDDRGTSEVQVCERNHQPGDDVTVVVNAVALSLDGCLMGTAEMRLPEDGIGGFVCLKFWASESLNRAFSLATIVYEPHRDACISAIAFHPTRKMAVSSSFGGDFKVWMCVGEHQHNEQTPQYNSWTCHAVGSYKKKPITAVAFSGDGSVLAVAADTVITLWNADKNVLLAVLGEMQSRITRLSFVGMSELLAAASQGVNPQLAVWNLSKLSLSWLYKLSIEAMASAMDSSAFAVLALVPGSSTFVGSDESACHGTDGMILLFHGMDPTPVAIWSVTKAKGGSLAFLKGNPSLMEENSLNEKTSPLLLAYVNGDHEYVLFDPYSDDTHERSVIRPEGLVTEDNSGKYGYASLYGELPKMEAKRSKSLWTPSVSTERPWETIFSGSTYNLPPLTNLCAAFFESMLEKRNPTVE